jgi:hypothetical protein
MPNFLMCVWTCTSIKALCRAVEREAVAKFQSALFLAPVFNFERLARGTTHTVVVVIR